MAVLSLGGREVRGYGFTITGEQPLPEEDLSAQTSSTLTSEKGFKGKRLRVKMGITFENAGDLKALTNMAQDVDDKGRRKVYTVNNQTAAALGVRQVRFSERLTAQELDGTQAWSISFVLLEHKSVPEKREEKALVSDGVAVAVGSQADKRVIEEIEKGEDSWIEKGLSFANDIARKFSEEEMDET